MSKSDCEGRRMLDDLFGGDLEAYADDAAGPKPDGAETDRNHPWHQRRRVARLTVDLPDDHVLPGQLCKLYTRGEVCELMGWSDSGFGKHKVPARCRSGAYACYALSDVMAYAAARAWRRAYEESRGERPGESIHQTAARLRVEEQNSDGPPAVWYPAADLSALQQGPWS